MNKVLLIIPKYNTENGNKKSYNYEMPIGLGYINAVLKKEGYDTNCLNLNHIDGPIKDIVEGELNKRDYSFVCTGDVGTGFPIIKKILDAVDTHITNPKIILGGSIVSSEPFFMMEHLKFDYGVIGEGELTIIDLLDSIKNNKDISKVKGIVYKDLNGKIIITSPRERIKDLDSLSFSDYNDFDLNEKLANTHANSSLVGTIDYPRTYLLIGSRGCPFQCTFCYHTVGYQYTTRSLKNIIQEIEFAIDKYKINSFQLHDDLFSTNKKRLYDFCKEIKELNKRKKINLKWMCSLFVSTIDEEILNILKDAGCLVISLGFESYSQEVLKSMKKNITPKQIDNAIKLCMKFKMPIIGNFIFGDIAETKETAKITLDYWKKHCKDQIKLFFIHPYPGSEIYNHCIKKGLIKDKLDYFQNKIFHTFFMNMTNEMSDKEFEELKKEVYELKIKSGNYVIPFKVEQEKKNRYSLYVKCPFCKKTSAHKNNYIQTRFFYRFHIHCRNCGMRFHLVSKLYKFTMDYYFKLDFFRRNFLKYEGMFLRRNV